MRSSHRRLQPLATTGHTVPTPLYLRAVLRGNPSNR